MAVHRASRVELMCLKRRRAIISIILLLLFPLYLFYEPVFAHLESIGLFFRNRYYNQALYRSPPVLADNSSLLLYWTPFFQNVAFAGFGNQPFAHCAVNSCVATNDRRYLSRARAVLFHGADMSMWDVPAERMQHQLYIYYVLEAPPLLRLPLGSLNTVFNITMTYRRDSDIHMPYEQLERRDPAAAPEEATPPPRPSDGQPAVAWVVSHCHTPGRREDYVAQLRRYMAVDEWGACSARPCPAANVLECYRHLARTHTFYLAFENSLCRDYITEKFFTALLAGLVPVVRGATRAEYEAVAPPDAFLHVDDFEGPRELADHLRFLARNATALARLTAWRHQYQFVTRDHWCRLCAMMSQPQAPGSRRVSDLRKWWYVGARCHQ